MFSLLGGLTVIWIWASIFSLWIKYYTLSSTLSAPKYINNFLCWCSCNTMQCLEIKLGWWCWTNCICCIPERNIFSARGIRKLQFIVNLCFEYWEVERHFNCVSCECVLQKYWIKIKFGRFFIEMVSAVLILSAESNILNRFSWFFLYILHVGSKPIKRSRRWRWRRPKRGRKEKEIRASSTHTSWQKAKEDKGTRCSSKITCWFVLPLHFHPLPIKSLANFLTLHF